MKDLDWGVIKEEDAGGSGGTKKHSELEELDYASSGHTGFARSSDIPSKVSQLSNDKGFLVEQDIMSPPVTTSFTSNSARYGFVAQGVYMDTAAPYVRRVILLMPVCRANVQWNNSCVGTFVLRKNGSNIFNVLDVRAQSTYNNTLVGIMTMGASSQTITFGLCMYEGVEWLVLIVKYEANPFNNMWFYGFSVVQHTDEHRLKCLAYYNEQTGTALIPEINNTLVPYASNQSFYVNGVPL